MKIKPRLAEFEHSLIPIKDIQQFYTLDDIQVPSDRPYTWSDTITSLDGVIHFLEEKDNVGSIGFKNIPHLADYQKADYRLLNASWCYADAVLISGQNLRDETDSDCIIKFPDLIQFRKEILLKKTNQPITCIVSTHCDFPLIAPVFHDSDIEVWIFTSQIGKTNFEKNRNQYGDINVKWSNITIFDVSENGQVDIKAMFKQLKAANINYLDICSGGSFKRQCLDLGILDEIRMTQAGQIAGFYNSQGEKRPTVFPDNPAAMNFIPQNAPLVAWKGIRTIGEHLIFYRGLVTYRH
ncbi:hypothetical protein BC833DRAFT_606872 [Globomyces pollinis-pini]|nr:hypothetical protein BC833DRAFT_606872 [Globomyces pollinis-pini]